MHQDVTVAQAGVEAVDELRLLFLALHRHHRSVTDLPLIAYPNAGRAYDATTKTWSGAASSWGGDAAIVGGCCGVGPRAIAAS